jgi:hypothetical protein
MTRFFARCLPAGVLLACQGEPLTPTAIRPSGDVTALATDNVVANVKMVPDSQMVFVNDQYTVTAQPRNKAGQVLDKPITWTVTNTKIVTIVGATGPVMTLKAIKIGQTSVKATADGKSKYSKVVVRSVSGAKVVVTPGQAAVQAGGTVQFSAQGLTSAGETAGVNVTWTSATGTISATGLLAVGNTPGTYNVIAKSSFGAADTSLVTVGAAPEVPDTIILVPETADVSAGGSVDFAVYGLTADGDSIGVDDVSYTAQGGTITSGGKFTAGGTAGTYRVIATSGGLADTSQVTVEGAEIDHVSLLPDVAASRPGEKTTFVSTVFNTLGEPVSEPVTYDATCGQVTATGVFTSPSNGSSCTVTATSNGKSSSTEVMPLISSPDVGRPFGISELWTSGGTSIRSSGVAAFTSSNDYVAPSAMVNHIATARARGIHVLLVMTGGSHSRYKTDGVFDMAKWKAWMETFNTPSIRDAIAAGVADGTVIGNSVMDEPQQHGNSTDPEKTWGPSGTMNKARVDSMCGYVKNIFPTLPVGVVHDATVFQPGISYHVCEFLVTQYAARKGSITSWRDQALSITQRDGMEVIFSLNLLNGGTQSTWPCPVPQTGGNGTDSPNCQMTAKQIRDWGTLLAPLGCAMMSWRYDAAFVAKPENQAAFSAIALSVADLPRKACRGSRP